MVFKKIKALPTQLRRKTGAVRNAAKANDWCDGVSEYIGAVMRSALEVWSGTAFSSANNWRLDVFWAEAIYLIFLWFVKIKLGP